MLNAIARPFGMLLMFLYDTVQNYGVSIIFFALVIKIILLPFQMKSKRGMMKQQRLQPKIAELQKKHGTNKQKINEEMAKLYKEEGVNPASGCLWGFLPLPIMLALYQVIRQPITIMMGVAADLLAEGGALLDKLTSLGFNQTMSATYAQIEQAQFISTHFREFEGISEVLRRINFNFLGIDLGLRPAWNFLWNNQLDVYGTWWVGFALFLIPLISGGFQLLATMVNRKLNPVATPEGGGGSMQIMLMLMPLLSVYIAFITPGALGFYWTVSTIFQLVQDVVLTKVYTKKIDAEEALKNEERARKEAEIEAKRVETERKKAEGLIERNPNTSKRKMQKSGKQEQLEKAAEWEKKNSPDDEDEKYEPSRVGNRRYARGRAYDPDRYSREDGEENAAGEGNDEEEEDRISEASLISDGVDDDEDDGTGSSNYDYDEDACSDDDAEPELPDSQDNGSASDTEDSDEPNVTPPTRFETKRFDENDL